MLKRSQFKSQSTVLFIKLLWAGQVPWTQVHGSEQSEGRSGCDFDNEGYQIVLSPFCYHCSRLCSSDMTLPLGNIRQLPKLLVFSFIKDEVLSNLTYSLFLREVVVGCSFLSLLASHTKISWPSLDMRHIEDQRVGSEQERHFQRLSDNKVSWVGPEPVSSAFTRKVIWSQLPGNCWKFKMKFPNLSRADMINTVIFCKYMPQSN